VNDPNNVIDLDDNDLVQTPEEQAMHKATYLQNLTARVLLRTHSLLSAPNGEDLYWLLASLACYMSAKGVKVTSDKAALLTWHTATCGECDMDSDGSMNSGCDTYDEYVHGLQWMSPNFPVEQVRGRATRSARSSPEIRRRMASW